MNNQDYYYYDPSYGGYGNYNGPPNDASYRNYRPEEGFRERAMDNGRPISSDPYNNHHGSSSSGSPNPTSQPRSVSPTPTQQVAESSEATITTAVTDGKSDTGVTTATIDGDKNESSKVEDTK
jgi:hypothetical protein